LFIILQVYTAIMKYPKYPVEASDPYSYEFYSEGPMGRIRKIVLYEKIGNDLFNLGFGDWNEEGTFRQSLGAYSTR